MGISANAAAGLSGQMFLGLKVMGQVEGWTAVEWERFGTGFVFNGG